MNILCILIPLLVGLICAIFGYLLGQWLFKQSRHYIQLVDDLRSCRAMSAELQLSLEKLNTQHADLKIRYAALLVPPFNAALAESVFGKPITENDLKIVEGIGPKIEELFHNAGILTWKAFADLTVDQCQAVLDKGGERYRIHDPATWPEQCKLAFQGKWQELKDWQDNLKGGR